MPLSAAVVTIGTELVEGARVDTNTAEIARALSPRGFSVLETVSVGDDVALLAEELSRLISCRDLVVTTGGLGPTHDDMTREAASRALGLELVVDPRLAGMLVPVQRRHTDPAAAEQVLAQAMVLPGAEVDRLHDRDRTRSRRPERGRCDTRAVAWPAIRDAADARSAA